MIKILAVSVVSVILLSVLRQYKSDYSIVLKLAVIVLIGYLIINIYRDSFVELSLFYDLKTDSPSYLPIIIKTLLIVLVTQLSTDICRESGEETISFMVELAGKVSVLIVSVPLLEALYQLAKGYLEL